VLLKAIFTPHMTRFELFYQASWYASNQAIWRHIFVYYCTSGNNRTVMNGNAR